MTYNNIDRMPGPTPEAQAAQLRQRELLTAVYAAYNRTRDYDSPEYARANAAYDESVSALVAMLGNDVPCECVDCSLSDMFSDYYKDVVGFRPRNQNYSRQQMLDWCERQKATATSD